jgi:hypothetical protein
VSDPEVLRNARADKRAEQLADLADRERACWGAAEMFMKNRDAHGIMDMGCEIQALQRAQRELAKL